MKPGLCVYCSRPANFTCSFCGALICPLHFEMEKGICKKCVMGRMGSGPNKGNPS